MKNSSDEDQYGIRLLTRITQRGFRRCFGSIEQYFLCVGKRRNQGMQNIDKMYQIAPN